MGTEGEDGRVVAGRYRLRTRLGRGGMGVVWRAYDDLLGRHVAVKEIPLDLDETSPAEEARHVRARALREARAVAQLHHPHIVVVHDVVEDGERPYLVMELLEGGSLADRIAEHGPVDAVEAARIGIALLGALATAHEAGVLHRDLKPANVLLDATGDRFVLTDFGIAQVAGAATLTESGAFVGSPEYTAPERMSGARSGPKSDLWSLGALLCTALSGESPFHRDSLGGILHAVVTDEIRPPAEAAPLLPLIRGLLERDPERRLDAAQAEGMLRVFLDTGRTPPSPAERAALTAALEAAGSARRLLVTALLVAATAGAGVSAAALLVNGGLDGLADGGGTATTPATTSMSAAGPPANSLPPAPTSAPSGYRVADDPAGFSLAVPVSFTRRPQGERVFYLSPGQTIRLGVKSAAPQEGGPLGVLRRAAANGPATNPGYRDGRVTATTRHGLPAAHWEFTSDGATTAGGALRTYDLCWEEGGRMYDVWVTAPVGQAREAKEFFDVAVDTFTRT
ncbi:serine/threonine-protein kinase [Streptomyces sp. NPDC087294]|uniref:serine/threonine-protein kinase n=1 Tax=Streptomyces sp. NPDC087294 TaxID=3365777 RepID=UPI00381D2065